MRIDGFRHRWDDDAVDYGLNEREGVRRDLRRSQTAPQYVDLFVKQFGMIGDVGDFGGQWLSMSRLISRVELSGLLSPWTDDRNPLSSSMRSEAGSEAEAKLHSHGTFTEDRFRSIVLSAQKTPNT